MTADDDLREFQANAECVRDARYAELRRRARIHAQREGRPDASRQLIESEMLGVLAQHLLQWESIESVTGIIESLLLTDLAMPRTDATEGAAAEIVGLAYCMRYAKWPWSEDDEEDKDDE
jgi:hypothetical protein